MGGVLGVFKRNPYAGLIRAFDERQWKDAEPDQKDTTLYQDCGDALAKTPQLITQLQEYKQCDDWIRTAMGEPTPDNEYDAFKAVTQNAEIIHGFWRFSKELEDLVPRLLKAMSGDQPMLEQQALAKRFAELIEFVLRFDELKMLQPGLQNDFSFYRRSLGKHAADPDLLVKDDDASFISMFLAGHIPMMTSVSKTTLQAFQDDEDITQVIADFANACVMLLKYRKFPANDPNNKLCLRAMVGAVVLYDHVEPEGAFHRRSPVAMKKLCTVLTRAFPRDNPQLCKDNLIDGLSGVLRFSTLHFSDESTPSNIVNLLER